MSRSAQRGFAPLLLLLIVAVVIGVGVYVYTTMVAPKNSDTSVAPSYTDASPSPSASTKSVTPELNKVSQSSESAKVAPDTAEVATYLVCPKYVGPGAIGYPPFPAEGPSPLVATVYANGSFDNGVGDSLAGYDWDLEGDGKFDITVSTQGVTHTYSKVGTYTPKFRLRSTLGKVSSSCTYPHKVAVDSGKATTNAISIDRTDVSVTLSKGNPNKVLIEQDNGSYTEGNLYGSAFTISMLKSNRWQLVDAAGATDVTLDMTEKTAVVGESQRVHVVSPATLANGNYKSSYKLQYFLDSSWHDFATINLNVTVKD